jgi:hypothetical protein
MIKWSIRNHIISDVEQKRNTPIDIMGSNTCEDFNVRCSCANIGNSGEGALLLKALYPSFKSRSESNRYSHRRGYQQSICIAAPKMNEINLITIYSWLELIHYVDEQGSRMSVRIVYIYRRGIYCSLILCFLSCISKSMY